MAHSIASLPDRPACRPGQPCRLNGLRMLLVDDDPLRRSRRVPAFERHGFEVCAVASPAEAIATLRDGWVCDMTVIDLRDGAARAVSLVNALRGLRAWLPAVIVGQDGPPAGVMLMDPGVRTLFMPEVESTLTLSGAVLKACCPGSEPDYCPFRGLIGSMRAPRRAPATGATMAAC